MIGTTLAHYEIEGRLGEGGSGVVYRGRDLRLDREVAIKVLADALRDDELAWARLLREARLASQLNHPHIAAIYDLGEEDGCAYIVMEYVEGLALSDIIPFGGMPSEQLGRYMAQIGSALGFAHDHGVIHGDLKGSNIIVTSEGDIKLLDFGLGRRIPRNGMAEVSSSCLTLADGGATAGTLPYLAPEVLRGQPFQPRERCVGAGSAALPNGYRRATLQRGHAVRIERGNHGGRASQARRTARAAPSHTAHLSREGPQGPPDPSARTQQRARGKPRGDRAPIVSRAGRNANNCRGTNGCTSRCAQASLVVGGGRNCARSFVAGGRLRTARLGSAASSPAESPVPGAQSFRGGNSRGRGLGKHELRNLPLPWHTMVRKDACGRVHDAETGSRQRLSSRRGPGLHVTDWPHGCAEVFAPGERQASGGNLVNRPRPSRSTRQCRWSCRGSRHSGRCSSRRCRSGRNS